MNIKQLKKIYFYINLAVLVVIAAIIVYDLLITPSKINRLFYFLIGFTGFIGIINLLMQRKLSRFLTQLYNCLYNIDIVSKSDKSDDLKSVTDTDVNMVFNKLIDLINSFNRRNKKLEKQEKKLKKSEEKYRTLVENLNNVLFATDSNYSLTYLSPSFQSFCKADMEDYMSISVLDFADEEYKNKLSFFLKEYKNEGGRNVIEFKTRFDKCSWVEMQFHKIEVNNKVIAFQGIMSDITERKLVEREVNHANKQILFQQKNITDSILYAEKIQEAVLPRPSYIKKCLPRNFVLFKPKDIVSGDFYWITRKAATIMIAVADCTGHGVPGAFMSLLGISSLNDILRKSMKNFFMGRLTASDMLEQLRKNIKKALKQKSTDSLTKDGMDMAFVIIDLDTNSLQFSGAFSPLLIVRDKKLIKIKGDRNPIGIHLKERPFTNHEMQLQKDDTIYMLTDGYSDQFGGDSYEKFLSKRLEELLLKNHQKPMTKQKEILDKTITKWLGDNEQIDDICIIGFKID